MGVDLGRNRPGVGCRALIDESPILARVIPAIPSFSVDGGFRYAVPETLRDRIGVGSIVRVPLSGRRVRGFVVDLEHDDPSGLREIAQVSGRSPVFDAVHLGALRWCATHYIAPLATVLERAAPPNNPPSAPAPPIKGSMGSHTGTGLSPPDLGLDRRRTAIWLTSHLDPEALAQLASAGHARGESTMVVLPTASETAAFAGRLAAVTALPVVTAHGDLSDREVTRAWGVARHHPVIIVGTPRISAWAIHELSLVVVVEEGRRAMKDRQTPTIHARELLKARAATERFGLVFAGPTPSVEVVAAGPRVARSPGRLWPLVEVVDRNDHPPGGGLLTDPARQAIRSIVRRSGSVFVFAHRRGYAAAVRCTRCRTVRRCPRCGSRPDPGTECSRCGVTIGPCASCGGERFEPLGAGVGRLVEELRRIVDGNLVGEHPFSGPVAVGTERDLSDLRTYDLVVFTDLDGVLFGTSYRAVEECLRIGARLAGAVGRGTGRRLLVQTTEPDHSVVVALRRADPLPALQMEAEARAAFGYPPAGELVVVEARGDADLEMIGSDLEGHSGDATIMGPAPLGEGHRWLVQAPSLARFRTAIRPAVQRWRDSGATIRIDADPIDL